MLKDNTIIPYINQNEPFTTVVIYCTIGEGELLKCFSSHIDILLFLDYYLSIVLGVDWILIAFLFFFVDNAAIIHFILISIIFKALVQFSSEFPFHLKWIV